MFSSPFSLVKSHGQRRPPCFAQGGLLGDAKPAAAQCDHISLGQLLRVGVFQGLDQKNHETGSNQISARKMVKPAKMGVIELIE
jgi:hypothetical protein